jgi:hypothetical protein
MVESGDPLQQDAANVCAGQGLVLKPILSSFCQCIGRVIGRNLVGAQCADINVSIFSKSVPLCPK